MIKLVYFVPTRKRLAAAGNVAGVHGYSHDKGVCRWTKARVLDGIVRTRDLVAEATGLIPTLVRMPFGSISDNILSVVEELGMQYVGWSLIARDWLPQMRLAKIVRKMMPGTVLLFHDGRRVNAHRVERTLPAIEGLLQWGMANGYSFVTVPELLGEWDHGAESLVGDTRLLGVRTFVEDGVTVVTPMWSPEDLLGGIGFEVSVGAKSVACSIAPMSNVQDWMPPIRVDGMGDVSVRHMAEPKGKLA